MKLNIKNAMAILFQVFLMEYLLIKTVSEINKNSLEQTSLAIMLLFLTIVSGIVYYYYFYPIKKQGDILSFIEKRPNLFYRLLITIISSVIVAYVIYIKTYLWEPYPFIIIASVFTITFLTIYYSLSNE